MHSFGGTSKHLYDLYFGIGNILIINLLIGNILIIKYFNHFNHFSQRKCCVKTRLPLTLCIFSFKDLTQIYSCELEFTMSKNHITIHCSFLKDALQVIISYILFKYRITSYLLNYKETEFVNHGIIWIMTCYKSMEFASKFTDYCTSRTVMHDFFFFNKACYRQ